MKRLERPDLRARRDAAERAGFYPLSGRRSSRAWAHPDRPGTHYSLAAAAAEARRMLEAEADAAE